MSIISIKNLSKKFVIESTRPGLLSAIFNLKSKKDILALKNINLEITKGRIIGIIGENGSGKTTLLRIMADVLKPTSGTVQTNGKVLGFFGAPESLSPRMSLKESIYIWCAFAGLSKKEVDKIYDSIISFAEIEEFKNASSRQFSLGMITRVIVSIGFNINPEVLLLDEILSPLDTHFRQKTLDHIKKLSLQGTAIILISHDVDLIKEFCDKVLIMEKGEIKLLPQQ